MKKIVSFCFVVVFAFFVSANSLFAANNNLVRNGGFESSVVTHPLNWFIYPDGTNGLGWDVQWYGGSTTYLYEGQTYTRPEKANLEIHKYYSGWSPEVPNQYVELDTDWAGPGYLPYYEPASVKISQTINVNNSSCRKGETFTLSYSSGARPNVPENKMEVYWNGHLIKTHDVSGMGNTDIVWNDTTKQNLGSKNGKIKLAFIETGAPDGLGMLLDDVAVFRKCVR